MLARSTRSSLALVEGHVGADASTALAAASGQRSVCVGISVTGRMVVARRGIKSRFRADPQAVRGNPSFRATPSCKSLSARSLLTRTVRVDAQWTSSSIRDLRTNNHLFDAFERRELEHGVEQYRFHDRTQAAR